MLLDRPFEEIIAVVGHDGSEILWPEMEDFSKHKCFQLEEMQYVALYFGHALIPYTKDLEYSPGPSGIATYDFTTLFNQVLQDNGIMLGGYIGQPFAHAVAWNATEQMIYDPAGRLATPYQFDCREFLRVSKL